MTFFAQIIRELMAAGLQGNELAAAIERIELSEQTVTERNEPSRAALRQRRYRERNKASQTVTSNGETVTERNEPDHNVINLPSISKKEIDNNGPKPVTRNAARHVYTPLFETFWKAYPKDENMSKWEAFQVFSRLLPGDQQAAIDSLARFRAYCSKKPDYRPVHAVRYLKWRRFVGFNEASTTEDLTTRHKNSPQPHETRAQYIKRLVQENQQS